jgi:hypothetical protein
MITQLTPYFPNYSVLDLELKLAQAETLISSYAIARRSLAITKYNETKILPYSKSFLLSYFPVSNSNQHPITIQVRNNDAWQPVTSYSIDYELGEIELTQAVNIFPSTIYRTPYYARNSTQVQISYFAGLDLETNATYIKNLVNLIKFLASDTNAGLTKFKLDEHYEVTYADSRLAANGNQLQDILSWFKQFRPRNFNC